MSLGCHVEGAALPKPERYTLDSQLGAVRKRMTQKMPDQDPLVMKRLKEFVRNWIESNLLPLDADTDVTLETWLAKKKTYTESRKQQLREACARYEADPTNAKWEKVNAFIKDENYESYKYARGIYSRSDEFKSFCGPTVSAIEEVVYKLPQFIKHVPVSDRPRWLYEKLSKQGTLFFATDFTSFEAIFTREMMECVEFQLYRYMTRNLPGGVAWADKLCRVLGGTHDITFSTLGLKMCDRRLSGEMVTSLGNTFTNLMLLLFAAKEGGCEPMDDSVGVEGDDSTFAPNPPERFPNADWFRKLGCIIKLEKYERLSDVSFCGLLFAEGVQHTLTNPLVEIAQLGWATDRYINSSEKKLLSLLRCKALSLVHQYPGAPVIRALGEYALRVTRSVRYGDLWRAVHGSMNQWEIEQFVQFDYADESNVPKVEVHAFSRVLIEETFGLSVAEQLALERYFANKQTLGPISVTEIGHLVPYDWLDYFHRYSHVSYSGQLTT